VTTYRPTAARIDLDAIRRNVSVLKPAGADLMAVVKSDGYGHGAIEVARAAIEAGAAWLGVALVEEGIGLREAGLSVPVLVLSEFPPGSEKDALAADLTPTVYTARGLGAVAEAAAALGRRAAVHVKLDTGMHRAGLHPLADAPAFIRSVLDAGCDLEGLWTHFARAEEDEATTRRQLDSFTEVLDGIRDEGIEPRVVHAANSAATILYPETHFDLVRIGIALYGLDPGGGAGARAGIRPAMSLTSEVSAVRRLSAGEAVSYGHRYRTEAETWVATVPIGYADGYRRALSSRAEVLLGGRRRRVAGTVTMDQILVDCGEDQVEVGDEVVLLGRRGDEEITADELAELCGTINYEITCGIGPRVPRTYVP
jgi:alanine racemase